MFFHNQNCFRFSWIVRIITIYGEWCFHFKTRLSTINSTFNLTNPQVVQLFPEKVTIFPPTPKKISYSNPSFFQGGERFLPVVVRPAVPKRQLSLRSGCMATRRWGCFWETRGPPFWGLFLFENFSLGGWLCSHRKYRNIPLSATKW